MNSNRIRAGFTLVELMIVVAIIAIIASIALPKFQSARLAANENVAIETLRTLSSAQAQIQASVAIDTDADGSGEYGYLAELAGTAPLRVSVAGAPAAGAVGVDELRPTVLSRFFGNVDPNGVVVRSGYCFAVWLPSSGLAPVGVGETSGGGAGAWLPGADNGECYWCAYAWPLSAKHTGNRVFFINEDGDLLQMNNRGITGPQYSAAIGGPHSSAAYTFNSMSAPPAAGSVGVDGNTWVPVQ